MELFGVTFVAVLLLLGNCHALETKLWQEFEKGAKVVPALSVEMIDGEELRNTTILVLSNYLSLLDVEISRLMTWGVREITQPCGLRFREIVDLQPSVGPSAPKDLFDYQLFYLTNAFRNLLSSLPEQKIKEREQFDVAPRNPSPRWTLNHLFNDLDGVLEYDLEKLRAWILELFDTGIASAKTKFSNIQEEGRREYLFTAVESLQHDVNTIEKYHSSLHQYSTGQLFEDYLAAREALLAIKLPSL